MESKVHTDPPATRVAAHGKNHAVSHEDFVVIGVDIAWGEKSADGLCVIRNEKRKRWVAESFVSNGDAALVEAVRVQAGQVATVQVAVDGPVICHNLTGARPVDRETHRRFGRMKCGCYPANLALCPRPARIAALFDALDLPVAWEGPRAVYEVYPHPAVVRWGGLAERIPYKKGRVEERRRGFVRLQMVLKEIIGRFFSSLSTDPLCNQLLDQSWCKPVEDRTDALICALIGLWHWEHRGKRTERLGEAETGFLLVPNP